MPDETPKPTVYVPPGPLGEGAARAATAGEKEDPTGAGLDGASLAGVYLHDIVPRPYSLLAFEMINVYVDAMRMFIRDCLPAPLGVSLDDQILKVMSPEECENLRRRLTEHGRQGVIHTIDTKHFPFVLGSNWVSLKRHFTDQCSPFDRMDKIHDIRNTVCHQTSRDITKAHAERCYRAISEMLRCTGPTRALEMVDAIWSRSDHVPTGADGDKGTLSELQIKLDSARVALSGVSQLVFDLRKQEVTLVSNKRRVAPRRVVKMLNIRIRRIARNRTRVRRRP